MMQKRFPKPQGLYDPANEHDNCEIGFVANIKGQQTNIFSTWDLFGKDLKKLFAVIEPDMNDSASLDNVLEFLF